MIPYFQQPSLALGPLNVHAFGVLVACAVMFGVSVLHRRAAAAGLPAAEVSRFVNWILLGGFAGAHLVNRFVYFPGETLAHPISVLQFWDGLSSFGGFLGGTVGALLFFQRHAGPTPGTAWKYADSFAYAFPFGSISGVWGASWPTTTPVGRPDFFWDRPTGTDWSDTTWGWRKRSTRW